MTRLTPIDFCAYRRARENERRAEQWLGPGEAQRLAGVRSGAARLMAAGEIYGNFLFAEPAVEEQLLPPGQRPAWNRLLAYVERQEDLELVIDDVKPEHYLEGDKVIVIKASRPFWDIFPYNEKLQSEGDWEAWIGKVKSARFYSAPTHGPASTKLFHLGYTLAEARRLTEEEMKSLVKVRRYEHHPNLNRLKDLELGGETMTISAPVPKLALAILEHSLKSDELAVEHLRGRFHLDFDLLPYYGDGPKLAGGRTTFFTCYEDSELARPALIAETTDLEALFRRVWPPVSLLARNNRAVQTGALDFHLVLAKIAHPNFTAADWEKIEAVAPRIRDKWLYKLLAEKGLHFPGQSIVFPQFFFPAGVPSNSETKTLQYQAEEAAMKLAAKLLGREATPRNLSLVFSMWEKGQDRMQAQINLGDFRTPNAFNALGEFVEITI